MKTVQQGVPLEPQALEALADDFGRKSDDKAAAALHKALADFPKTSALPVLQQLANAPLENPVRAVTWGQWGALRFIDLEYAGQGLPLVDLYLRSLESSDCRVRALAAKRLGELRNGSALEPLRKLRDLPHKKDEECGQGAAALAVRSLEKDLNP
jgi:serine/threonine-protein kinase